MATTATSITTNADGAGADIVSRTIVVSDENPAIGPIYELICYVQKRDSLGSSAKTAVDDAIVAATVLAATPGPR